MYISPLPHWVPIERAALPLKHTNISSLVPASQCTTRNLQSRIQKSLELPSSSNPDKANLRKELHFGQLPQNSQGDLFVQSQRCCGGTGSRSEIVQHPREVIWGPLLLLPFLWRGQSWLRGTESNNPCRSFNARLAHSLHTACWYSGWGPAHFSVVRNTSHCKSPLGHVRFPYLSGNKKKVTGMITSQSGFLGPVVKKLGFLKTQFNGCPQPQLFPLSYLLRRNLSSTSG